MSDTGAVRPTAYEGGFEDAAPPTTHEGSSPQRTTREGVLPTQLEGGIASPRRRRLVLPDPLIDEYEYEADLSSGAQADVVLCTRRQDGTRVAIKLYRGDLGRVDQDALAKLHGADPNHVVPLLDLQTWQGETWEVQEYFPQGSLAQLLARTGPMAGTQAHDLLVELASAISHIHDRDIVHRDLKPANVLIRTFEPFDCVLADFGLATQLLVSRAARSVAGTMAYTAPEASYGDLHKAADWWSLGVILHEAITGSHLFSDPETGLLLSDHQIRVNLNQGDYAISGLPDEKWQLLIRGLLTRNPDYRWAWPEVQEWLSGETPAVVEEESTPVRQGVASFQFGEISCATPRELAAAIREDFDRAEAMLADVLSAERLRSWLRAHGYGVEVDNYFGRIDNRKVLTMRLVQLQLVMDPSAPAVFRSRPLTSESIQEVCALAEAGDRAASAWITDLREHQVLAAWASELESGQAIAAADERLRAWWGRLSTGAAAIGSAAQAQLSNCEGPLLRAAFSEDLRTRIGERAELALQGSDSLLPSWARTLAHDARSTDPQILGLKVLATAVIPPEREMAQRARDVQAEAERKRASAQAQRAAAEAAAARRARAATAARARREADKVVIGGAVASCVTVLIPWLLGHFVLQDQLLWKTHPGVFDTSARSAGGYFSSNWQAGSSVVIVAAALFLLVRSWRGRTISVIIAIAAIVGACAWLIPMSVQNWDSAEAKTVHKLRTTDYPFASHYYTCGQAGVLVGGHPWTLFSAQVKGSNVNGCNRLNLYHGWKPITSIDLKAGRLVSDVSVHIGSRINTTFFRVTFENGGRRLIPLSKYYNKQWLPKAGHHAG